MKAVGISGVNITKGYSAINKRKKVLSKKRTDLKKKKIDQVWITDCILNNLNQIYIRSTFSNVVINFNGNQLSEGLITTIGKSNIYNYCIKGKIKIVKF